MGVYGSKYDSDAFYSTTQNDYSVSGRRPTTMLEDDLQDVGLGFIEMDTILYIILFIIIIILIGVLIYFYMKHRIHQKEKYKNNTPSPHCIRKLRFF